jgi:hypothetical protein
MTAALSHFPLMRPGESQKEEPGDAPSLRGLPDSVPGYHGGVGALDVKPTPPGA